MGRWQEIEHTADLALHVWGQDLRDLFATAARGMASLVAEVAPGAVPIVERRVTLSAPDVETLLVDWLNELLYLSEVEGVVFAKIEIPEISDSHLVATVGGYPVAEHLADIKATTFHNLAVIAGQVGYEVEIVFDI